MLDFSTPKSCFSTIPVPLYKTTQEVECWCKLSVWCRILKYLLGIENLSCY